MDWLSAVEELRRRREPGVLVTVAGVRGHAPREAGAKMVVTADATWGSIGGGNLEAVAVDRARQLLAVAGREPSMFTADLSDKAPVEHGVQCCGGQVTVLLEPLGVRPAVAIFGMGHVGLELARILARHDLELHLVDSRPEQLSAAALAPLDDAQASVHVHHVPVLPELVISELPAGTHVLIMTHDHAEDAALCDAALRAQTLESQGPGGKSPGGKSLGSIGLIGSSAKWSRFRKKLLGEGHSEEDVARITTPIGLSEIGGKEPATIAVSVAASLVQAFEAEQQQASVRAVPGP
jgi:xanthine dehydrogenase accessory factor